MREIGTKAVQSLSGTCQKERASNDHSCAEEGSNVTRDLSAKLAIKQVETLCSETMSRHYHVALQEGRSP